MRAFAVYSTGCLAVAVLLAACTNDSITTSNRISPTPTPTPTPTASSTPGSILQGIGNGGGNVTSADNLAWVAIPSGAVSALTDITITAVPKSVLPGDAASLHSGGYDFGPDRATFLHPVTVTLQADSRPGVGQRLLLAYLDDSNAWVPIGSSAYDANTTKVSAQVTHFSVYAALVVASGGDGCSTWVDADAFCAPQVCAAQANACGTPPPPTYYAITGNILGMVAGTYVTVHEDSQGDFNVTYPNTQFGLNKQFLSGETYSVSVAGSPGLRCVMLTAGGAIADSNVTLEATCSLYVTFANNQNASMVLGQPDLITGTANGEAQDLLRYPVGPVFLHPNGTFYVPDTDNARAMGYNTVPSANHASADFVLGQPDFVTHNGWNQDTPINTGIVPNSIYADNNYLVVADPYTNRVVIYQPVPTGGNPSIVAALGQPDTTTGGNANCTATSFATPAGVLIFHGKLLVADRYNHRVLIWNTVPTTSGAAPDLVLGQPDFNSCNHPGAVSPNTLAQPIGLWTDGNRLLVVDRDTSRVLAWNTFPTMNQQPADGFLGQLDFYSGDGFGDPNVLCSFPSSATSDGNRVYVTEPLRNRVTVWSGWPDAQNPPTMMAVLGQADNSGNVCNQNNTAPAANTLCDPEGVTLIGTRLWITDTGNSRVVVFDSM